MFSKVYKREPIQRIQAGATPAHAFPQKIAEGKEERKMAEYMIVYAKGNVRNALFLDDLHLADNIGNDLSFDGFKVEIYQRKTDVNGLDCYLPLIWFY